MTCTTVGHSYSIMPLCELYVYPVLECTNAIQIVNSLHNPCFKFYYRTFFLSAHLCCLLSIEDKKVLDWVELQSV